MVDTLKALLLSIDGLRSDVRDLAKDTRHRAIEQGRLTRQMTEAYRDLTEELRELRYQRDRLDRHEARLANLELMSGGAR